MKLLFDQNISFKIIKLLNDDFSESGQVRELGLENSSDLNIWQFALENGYSIVTFDADFSEIANLKGCPPKIIWLRTGNLSTNSISKLIIKNQNSIKEFIEDENNIEFCCLEIMDF